MRLSPGYEDRPRTWRLARAQLPLGGVGASLPIPSRQRRCHALLSETAPRQHAAIRTTRPPRSKSIRPDSRLKLKPIRLNHRCAASVPSTLILHRAARRFGRNSNESARMDWFCGACSHTRSDRRTSVTSNQLPIWFKDAHPSLTLAITYRTRKHSRSPIAHGG